MVQYENVKIGQKVEVRWRGQIVPGVVKYKGSLNGVRGEWVGVALDQPVGTHDGMVKGRRYFMCDAKHGIFTLASQIRFIKLKRSLYNSYRTKSDYETEYDLFGTCTPDDTKASFVVEGHAEKILTARYNDSLWDKPKNVSLRHSISSCVPPATATRPSTGRFQTGRSSREDRMYRSMDYENDYNDFIPSSSIPNIHMPHSALKKQVQLGWAKAPLVRYWSVHTGRDAIKQSQWNDISA